MAPSAVEAAWPEDAGLVAQAVAVRFFRIPIGTSAGRDGTAPLTVGDMAAGQDDPAVCGGRRPIRPTVVAQGAPAFHGATPCVSAEPCATGTDATGLARLACVPSIVLPATGLDQAGNSCPVIADAAQSDAAIASFHTA